MQRNRAFEDNLRKGFELACFLHADETTAFRVVTRAAEKLHVASAAQDKRLYYDALRTKVWFSDPDLLQRLIYVQSEPFERQSEESGRVGLERLIVYYVKHLVRITTKRNAFHVTLGISRILHNYTTTETMAIDERVGDAIRDDSYYRSRKAKLMFELRERFRDLLRLDRGPRGEERFQSLLSAAPYTNLVRRCLEHFTPWSTSCPSAGVSAMNDEAGNPGFRSNEKEDEAEIARMHAVLHPSCYDRLTWSLSLAPPDQRLEIPAFSIGISDADRPGGDDRPGRLEDDQVEEIKTLLSEQARRRKKAVPERMRVMVDGVERARIDVDSVSRVQFTVSEEAELIEVVSDDEAGPLLLATHLVTQDRSPVTASITLEGGQQFVFSVNAATIEITYREARLLRRWLHGAVLLRPALASLAVVAVVMWLAMREEGPGPSPVVPRPSPQRPTVTAPTLPVTAPAAAQKRPDVRASKDDAVDLEATRDAAAATSTRLADVTSICIEMKNVRAAGLEALIASAMRSDGIGVVACEDANVALKVREEAASAITVQLVDARGEVLWPTSSRVARYEGSGESMAASVAAAIREAIRDPR